MDNNKALSVDPVSSKVLVRTFSGEPTQKFTIVTEQNKFAFVCGVGAFQTGLCVFQDNQNKAAEIVVDQARHPSSWFEVTRVTVGKWTNKAYVIKTHANKQALDIAGGQATEGQKVLQYDLHGGDNQCWLILPA